ncbi:aerolysin family beta-barrel pore-forming toxin [Clostridiaceae bacterium M8S5]|nr:aerolysin family beta-barrel pore-forming toxin [Clostridiaceae bacterium M8S5]
MKIKSKFIKTVLYLFVAACLTLNLVPSNVAYAADTSITKYPPKLFPFINEEDLKAKIISSPEFIKNHANLAHYMGFGWCGGTASQYVGDDFEFRKDGDGYILQARYNPNDPHASGFWADKRLKMRVSNVRFYIDTESIVKGKEKVTSLDPVVAQTFDAVNNTNSEDTANASFTYTKGKTVTHSTNYSFEETIGVKHTASISVLFLSGSMTYGWEFKAGQSWSDSTANAESSTVTSNYQTTVPAKSKKIIKLMSYKTKSEVPYTANIYMDYDITFSGFLRWGGNARTDHPKDRPFVSVTFGKGDLTAQEEIQRMYDNKNIPGYSQWDWGWMEQQFGANAVKYYVSQICKPMGANIDGKFTCIDGTHVQVECDDPVPLTGNEASNSMTSKSLPNTFKAALTKTNGIKIDNVKFNDTPEVRVVKSSVDTGAGALNLRS